MALRIEALAAPRVPVFDQVQHDARPADAPENARDQASRIVALPVCNDRLQNIERQQSRQHDAEVQSREALFLEQPEQEQKCAGGDARATPTERPLRAPDVW